MTQRLKKAAAIAAIAIASIAATFGLSQFRFFQLLNLKAQDVHFVLRGTQPVKDIVILGIDNTTLADPDFLDPSIFWHKHYADAMTAAAAGGAKAFVLDVTFAIPVTQYEKPDNDSYLAAAYGAASQKMPIVCAFVPEAMGLSGKIPVRGSAKHDGRKDRYGSLRQPHRRFRCVCAHPGINRSALDRASDRAPSPAAWLSSRRKNTSASKRNSAATSSSSATGASPPSTATLTINFAGPPGTVPMFRSGNSSRPRTKMTSPLSAVGCKAK